MTPERERSTGAPLSNQDMRYGGGQRITPKMLQGSRISDKNPKDAEQNETILNRKPRRWTLGQRLKRLRYLH